MELLFYTTWDLTDENADGIAKKIRSQIQVLSERGYQVSYTYLKDGKVYLQQRNEVQCIGKAGISRKLRANYYISQMLKQKRFDCAYIRYGFADFYFVQALKRLKEKQTKILLEIPTYPYEKELRVNWSYRIVLLFDQLFRGRLKSYVDRVITYSDDREIYGIPTLRTVNGIDFNGIRKRKLSAALPGIHIIAVAGMAQWHAYDRILNGMGNYYRNGGREELVFHIVGDGPVLPGYKELAEKLHLHQRVIFHGFLDGKQLDEVYDSCSMAVSILGLHRRDGRKDTSLKAAEYGAKGLSIIATVPVDIYPDGNRFQLIVPGDESPVDIEQIIDFYNRTDDREEIAELIYNNARKYRDMSFTFEKIFQYIEEK